MNPKEQHITDELKKAKVPLPSDEYFAQLKSELLSQLPGQAKVVPFYKKWWAISAAASVALLIGLFFLKEEPAEQQTAAAPDWNSVSREEVLAYVEDNIDDFEPETLAQHLTAIPEWHETIPGNDLAEASMPVSGGNSTNTLFDELEDKEILEYLNEEAIEIDDELLIGS